MSTIDDEFYKDDNQEQTPEPEISKIKIGEEEFDPEEAQRLISLGKLGREAEEKYNTSIDKVYPEFTKKSQKLAELEKASQERERAELERKQQSGADLTPEEQARVARETLKKFGVMFEDEYQTRFDQDYTAREQAKEILSNVRATVREAKEKYGIDTDEKRLLTFMQAEGDRIGYDPNKALRELYEPRIKAWEDQQLEASKPQGLVTEAASTAGGKQPAQPRAVSKDQLLDQVMENLNRN